MSTQEKKVAAFRKRLAIRQASWAIDLPAKKRITLELTREQQAILMRTIKHVIPSLTLVFHSEELEPSGHALACLQIGDSPKTPKTPKTPRKPAPSR